MIRFNYNRLQSQSQSQTQTQPTDFQMNNIQESQNDTSSLQDESINHENSSSNPLKAVLYK